MTTLAQTVSCIDGYDPDALHVDKGLQPLRGKPMVAWAIARLKPQVDEIVINANQNLEIYRAFGSEASLGLEVFAGKHEFWGKQGFEFVRAHL